MPTLASVLYVDPTMAALWAGTNLVARVLDFEAALARAEGSAGSIPRDAVEVIDSAVRSGHFDTEALLREAAQTGSPAIPIIRALTERVAETGRDYVHWGATSQDAIDTALMLIMRDSLDILRGGLIRIGKRCVVLAEAHRHTLMASRTLLQQAGPITFGLKASRWLSLITRQVEQLSLSREQIGFVQLGGGSGTLAAFGDEGMRVMELLARELGLAAPMGPWHTERDRVARVGADVGVVAGALAKIACDLTLLAQTEVDEASDTHAAARGGSSAMPHKRNPTDAIAARAAARLALGVVPVLLGAMEQEHERAAGAWHTEWAALSDLFSYASGAVIRVESALATLEPDPERMRDNIDRAGGLILSEALTLALTPRLGKSQAQRVVSDIATRSQAAGGFARAARQDDRICAALAPDELERALDPMAFLGSNDLLIDRAVAAFRAVVV